MVSPLKDYEVEVTVKVTIHYATDAEQVKNWVESTNMWDDYIVTNIGEPRVVEEE